jgi:Cu/Ag efflux pump CusA
LVQDLRGPVFGALSRLLVQVLAAVADRGGIGTQQLGVAPQLGPDATSVGWVFQYALIDDTGRHDLADLRSFQDWYLRYQLTAVPGVSEVASIGGFERTYQVTVDPAKLRAFGIPITRVSAAIRASNQDIGAMMMEMAEREFMIRGLGYLTGIEDFENVVVGATVRGTPIRVVDVANVALPRPPMPPFAISTRSRRSPSGSWSGRAPADGTRSSGWA